MEPNDRYKGGYWFQYQPFGRYLHIIALKSPDVDQETNKCRRYNYIVHPLAYRSSIDTIPDNSVDAMQWCIINMPEEPHFGVGKDWGDKCHGLEIFNDFTFFHSYQPIEDGGPNNGELGIDITNRSINEDATYYYYFNTYPLEFGEFLLDSALARGVYYHTMVANDAFYERNSTEVACSDPKGYLHDYNRKCGRPKDPRTGVKKADPSRRRKSEDERKAGADLKKIASFMESLPYNERTVFGFVTMFDPRQRIKEAVFQEKDGISFMGLEAGENLTLDYLIKGRYYADTGVWELFAYDSHTLPYRIFNQPDPEELCHEISNDMELVFTFLPVSERNHELVWRYTIMVQKVYPLKPSMVVGIETTHGYFKLDLKASTKLDLRTGFEKSRVMWLYFTAFKPQNPQRRAWLHAIRGPAFGEPRLCARLPPLEHRIQTTTKTDNTIVPGTIITPTPVTCEKSLDFAFGKAENDRDIYVYSMQVMPHQQDLTTQPVSDRIKESSDHIPPRIMQNVHGYFNLRVDHPTRLNLSASWDSMTVQDPVLFYIIDGETGVPSPFAESERPILFGQNPSPLTAVSFLPPRQSTEPLTAEPSTKQPFPTSTLPAEPLPYAITIQPLLEELSIGRPLHTPSSTPESLPMRRISSPPLSPEQLLAKQLTPRQSSTERPSLEGSPTEESPLKESSTERPASLPRKQLTPLEPLRKQPDSRQRWLREQVHEELLSLKRKR